MSQADRFLGDRSGGSQKVAQASSLDMEMSAMLFRVLEERKTRIELAETLLKEKKKVHQIYEIIEQIRQRIEKKHVEVCVITSETRAFLEDFIKQYPEFGLTIERNDHSCLITYLGGKGNQ